MQPDQLDPTESAPEAPAPDPSAQTPDEYQLLCELFHQLADTPLGECRRILTERGIPENRARAVLELIERQHSPSPALDPALAEHLPALLAESAPQGRLGQDIGPYHLISVIGEGGMGTVFLAEQVEPIRRRVALKLVKRGMDSHQVLTRFEQERQALALMNHDGIARVLDAGTTEDGQPFFGMEFVDGEPITTYCERHGLPLAERIAVFQQVCQAIQHAHQKRILHRDIKPGNVLVTRHGEHHRVKVIDFGLARALQGDPTSEELTHHGTLIGTPDFMSPEQIRGSRDQLDTRTDIYSLGVLLFRLLTGTLPFRPGPRNEDMHALLDRILTTDPPRPSRCLSTQHGSPTSAAPARVHERQLRGDLDWITLKALEKDPDCRYASAADLAADLERSLRHRPVSAGPPRFWYRLSKALRRNRPLVLAACLVLLVLMAGIVTTGRQAIRAGEQARLAEAINEFLNEDLLAAVIPTAQDGAGHDVSLRAVLEVASQRIDQAVAAGGRFENEPWIEAELRSTLGVALAELGEIHTAERHLERCLELRRFLHGDSGEDTLLALIDLGSLRVHQMRLEEAEALFQEVLDLAHDASPGNVTIEALNGLGATYETWGKLERAESMYERGLERVKQQREDGLETDWSLEQLLHSNLGSLYLSADAYDSAVAPLERALALARQQGEEQEPLALISELNLAEALRGMGQAGEARQRLDELVPALRDLLGPSHPDTVAAMARHAHACIDTGALREAERIYREALDATTLVNTETANMRGNLAGLLAERGEYDEARVVLRDAVAEAERLPGYSDEDLAYMRAFLAELTGPLD